MGHLSAPVANLFMAEFEEESLETSKNEKPKEWRRYVDDVIAVVKRSLWRSPYFESQVRNTPLGSNN